MLIYVKRMENHKDYIIKDDKIGYLYEDQYDFNANYGYLTQFAYIREYE